MSGAGAGFSTRVVAALILVGVFTFAGFFVLSAYAPQLRDGNDGGAHGLSRSAVGYAALADLLDREGETVVLSRTPVGTDAQALWIVTPRGPFARIEALPGADVATLLVLPKWSTRPDDDVRGWVELIGTRRMADRTLTVQEHELSITISQRGPRAAPGPILFEDDERIPLSRAEDAPADPLPQTPPGVPIGEVSDEVAEEIAEEARELTEGTGLGNGSPAEAPAEGEVRGPGGRKGDRAAPGRGHHADQPEATDQPAENAEASREPEVQDAEGSEAEDDGGTAEMPGPEIPGFFRPYDELPVDDVRLISAPKVAVPVAPPLGPVTIRGLQTIEGFHVRPVWTDEEGRTVLGRVFFPAGHIEDDYGDAEILTDTYILSDPDLLNTLGLATPERAAVANGLIAGLAGERPVFFDLAGAGFGRAQNLLTLALEPPFLAATLAVLLAGALLAWIAAARFGPPKTDPVGLGLGKAALADQAAVLLDASGRDVTLGPRYAQLTRRRLAGLLGSPGMSDAELARAAKRAGLTDLAPASAAAHGAREAPALLGAARRLHDLTRSLITASSPGRTR